MTSIHRVENMTGPLTTQRMRVHTCDDRHAVIKAAKKNNFVNSSNMVFCIPATLIALLSLTSLRSTKAAPSIKARQSIDTTVHCGQFDTATEGSYTLFLDQFGSGGATSGSQCAHATALNGNTVSWATNWTWTGGSGVKSFSNIGQNANIGLELSTITAIPVS